MKRNKEWWDKYTKQERHFIYHFERNINKYNQMGGYLPDDCSECTNCGEPMLGSGVCCMHCFNDYDKLISR
jgi:hypothetical protein